MAETSKIEWTDSTFNPWVGCTKIAPACDHCYAADLSKRYGWAEWGNAPRKRTSESNWKNPLAWQRQAPKFYTEHGRRRRVFCASLADVFDNQVPTEWRDDLWALIRACPDLDWLLLTKRPQNIEKMLPAFWDEVKGHVWLGTTVEDQEHADRNIPHLLKHDSAVRFISVEPMLGPIDLRSIELGNGMFLDARFGTYGKRAVGSTFEDANEAVAALGPLPERTRSVDWVIAGGESGPHARASNPQWFRNLRDQCAAAGVPFLFKQWGEWVSVSEVAGPGSHLTFEDGRTVRRVGKKAAGRHLDGELHNGFPVAA